MASYIILTDSQKDTLRETLAEISPRYQTIQRADEKWILPKSILASVNHAAYHEFLRELPELVHNDPAFPGEYVPPEE